MTTKNYTVKNLRNLVKTSLYPEHEIAKRREIAFGDHNSIPKKIVIEFSSPNIAKPFHYGHLKSTIFGNYLANLHSHLGIDVVRLNYIGDWGTQFGLLGLQLDDTSTNLAKVSMIDHPISLLVKKYVEANERAKNDDSFFQRAKDYFNIMENSLHGEDSKPIAQWQEIRTLSMQELSSSYKELGISFDEYEYESDYSKISRTLVDELVAKGLAFRLEDGAAVVKVEKNNKSYEIPILKSDGSSLYLSRDLAAAIRRKEKYKFDKMFYVAGAEQERHFYALSQIYAKLAESHDEENGNLIHVKTGKVIGMSSRTGNFLLLSDLIREATSRYLTATKNTPTSKVNSSVEDDLGEGNKGDIDSVAQQLAVSAFFFFDLRFKRMRNYEFSWNNVMSDGSDSGLNLQATHARLCSLINRAKLETQLDMIQDCNETDWSAIDYDESINLLNVLGQFDASLGDSVKSLESAPLINYSAMLCRAINKARQSKNLRVLTDPDHEKARAKLTLFVKARDRLALIIKLIGLKPLEKI